MTQPRSRRPLALSALLLAAAAPVLAQNGQAPAAPPAAAPTVSATVTPAPPDLKGPYLRNWEDTATKLVSLAEAIPAEKYTWRPADGVRTVSAVFMHVAGGNFFLPTALGAQMPPGISREMEKETDKAKVVTALKDSIAHAKKAVEATDLTTLGQEVELFGRKMTRADVLLILLTHAHEHLGQAIAYARSNGVAPPWSRAEP